jgi:hypothetical protein
MTQHKAIIKTVTVFFQIDAQDVAAATVVVDVLVIIMMRRAVIFTTRGAERYTNESKEGSKTAPPMFSQVVAILVAMRRSTVKE